MLWLMLLPIYLCQAELALQADAENFSLKPRRGEIKWKYWYFVSQIDVDIAEKFSAPHCSKLLLTDSPKLSKSLQQITNKYLAKLLLSVLRFMALNKKLME